MAWPCCLWSLAAQREGGTGHARSEALLGLARRSHSLCPQPARAFAADGSSNVGSLHVAVYREPADDADDAAFAGCSPRLLVQLTDAEGRLVDNTDLRSVADMAGMDMGPLAFRPQQVGQGLYVVQLSFSMPGSWWVRLDARAPNHQQASQTLTFLVQNIPQASSAEMQAIMARVRHTLAR